MQAAIGYLRVSTREQGRSGLGLAAQRQEIEVFSAREGFSVKSWYQDVQTGAGADALLLLRATGLGPESAQAVLARVREPSSRSGSQDVGSIIGLRALRDASNEFLHEDRQNDLPGLHALGRPVGQAVQTRGHEDISGTRAQGNQAGGADNAAPLDLRAVY